MISMSRQFVDDFEKATTDTAPGSRGIAILNFLTIVGCVAGAPFTLGTSLFGLLALPIYSSLGSIANETFRTRKLVEMQLKIVADQEGLFEVRPPRPIRRNISNAPYPQESIEEEQWEDEEEVFEDYENQNVETSDSTEQSNEDQEKNKEKPDIE